jgi:uncharacterized phiE125 gp8 family phage protein
MQGPAVEPVTLEQCYAQIRGGAANDDGLFPIRIQAARELCEAYTHRAFFNQTWRLSLHHFPFFDWTTGTMPPTWKRDIWFFPYAWPAYQIKVPRPSLVSVSSITYLDAKGNQQTHDPSLYYVDPTSEPGIVVPKTGLEWPYPDTYLPGSVQLTYVAGSYGDGVEVNNCPARLIQAILLLVADMFENREQTSALAMKDLPMGIARLLEGEVFTIFGLENN